MYLRDPLWGNKAGGLHHRQASIREAVDKLDLGLCGDDGLFILEAVSGANLDNLDKL